jgi:hypothetical protein
MNLQLAGSAVTISSYNGLDLQTRDSAVCRASSSLAYIEDTLNDSGELSRRLEAAIVIHLQHRREEWQKNRKQRGEGLEEKSMCN